MDEEWRPVPGFPDYALSSLGRLRRRAPDRHGRMGPEFIKPAVGNHGYAVASLHRHARQTTKLMHRLVCEAFHGPAPTRHHQAAHYDGNRTNNRADNLRWATPSSNNLDKLKHGTMLTGERHPSRLHPERLPRGEAHKKSKLDDAAVLAIRSDPRPQSAIAAEYGVAQSLISMVKSGKIWTHIGAAQ